MPPYRAGALWRVVVDYADDSTLVREFADADRAREVYAAVQPQTRLVTLRGRGFRAQ